MFGSSGRLAFVLEELLVVKKYQNWIIFILGLVLVSAHAIWLYM